MNNFGLKAEKASLDSIGLQQVAAAHWNLTPAELVEECIIRGEGQLTNTGALAADTGEFTGRSPKDRFVVQDEITENTVWWGDVNIPFAPQDFDNLFNRVAAYLANREVFVKDSYA
jgi:phosphoenolpyruvate carboxykinase (ATP)